MGDKRKRLRCLRYRSVSSTTSGDPYLEHLIEEVRKYACLYDPDSVRYRDQSMKDECWDEIAKILHKNREDLKKDWKKLRDGYRQALVIRRLSGKKGSRKKALKPWKYEAQMDFLKPYIAPRSRLLVAARAVSSDDSDYCPIKEEVISDRNTELQRPIPLLQRPIVVNDYLIRETIRNIKPDPDAPPPPPRVDGKKRKKNATVGCVPRKRPASACPSIPPRSNGREDMPSVITAGSGDTQPVADNHGVMGNMPSTSNSGNNGPDGTSTQTATSSVNNTDTGPSNNNQGDCGNTLAPFKWSIGIITREKASSLPMQVVMALSNNNPINNGAAPSASNNGNTLSTSNNGRSQSLENNIHTSSTSNAETNFSTPNVSSFELTSDGENDDTTPTTGNALNNGSIPSNSNALNNGGAPSTSNAGDNGSTPSNSIAGNNGNTPPLDNAHNNGSTQSLSNARDNNRTPVLAKFCNKKFCTQKMSIPSNNCNTPSSSNAANNVGTPSPSNAANNVGTPSSSNAANNVGTPSSSNAANNAGTQSSSTVVNNGVTTSSNSSGIQGMSARFSRNFRNYATARPASNSPTNGAFVVFVNHDPNIRDNNGQPTEESLTSRTYNLQEFITDPLLTNRERNNGTSFNRVIATRNATPSTLRNRDQVYRATQQAPASQDFPPLRNNDQHLSAIQLFLASIYQTVKQLPLKYQNNVKINLLEFLKVAEEEFEQVKAHWAANAGPNAPRQPTGNPEPPRGSLQSATRFIGDNDPRHAHLQLFLASIHESLRNMPGYLLSYFKINSMEFVNNVEEGYKDGLRRRDTSR